MEIAEVEGGSIFWRFVNPTREAFSSVCFCAADIDEMGANDAWQNMKLRSG